MIRNRQIKCDTVQNMHIIVKKKKRREKWKILWTFND